MGFMSSRESPGIVVRLVAEICGTAFFASRSLSAVNVIVLDGEPDVTLKPEV